jgi:hypothetical protein
MNDKPISGFGLATIKGEGMIADPDEYEWKCGCAVCEVRYKNWKSDYDVQQAALRNEALDRKAENARELGLDYEPDLQAELDATNRQVEILSDALAESRREIDALVALARADERESCAKVCDRMAARCNDIRAAALESAAENIRARGNT